MPFGKTDKYLNIEITKVVFNNNTYNDDPQNSIMRMATVFSM